MSKDAWYACSIVVAIAAILALLVMGTIDEKFEAEKKEAAEKEKQVKQTPPQGRFRYLHKCSDTTTVEYRADRKLPQAVVCGE